MGGQNVRQAARLARAHRRVDETANRLRPAVLRLLAAAGDDDVARAVVQAGVSQTIDAAFQRWSVYHLGMDRQEFHLWVHDRIVRPPNDGDDELIDPPVC